MLQPHCQAQKQGTKLIFAMHLLQDEWLISLVLVLLVALPKWRMFIQELTRDAEMMSVSCCDPKGQAHQQCSKLTFAAHVTPGIHGSFVWRR